MEKSCNSPTQDSWIACGLAQALVTVRTVGSVLLGADGALGRAGARYSLLLGIHPYDPIDIGVNRASFISIDARLMPWVCSPMSPWPRLSTKGWLSPMGSCKPGKATVLSVEPPERPASSWKRRLCMCAEPTCVIEIGGSRVANL